MARVVLEKIYKSFASSVPQHRPDRASRSPNSVAKEQTGDRSVNVLQEIDLTIEDGEFMVLVGPSGCGKSTLLRTIAGLEELTAGNIYVGDRLVNNLPPKQRDIAMVFQSYALYPHLSVYDNIAFGLRRMGKEEKGKTLADRLGQWGENFWGGITRSLPSVWRYRSQREKAIFQRVQGVAELLQIEELLNRLPRQLSGGQKQRVALGRAISRNPQVFLMDEPLSNLDAKLRAETRSQIVQLQRELDITTIYVTHDQTEAMTMGDRIAVMNKGELQQIAKPLELYNNPANRFVAQFIGSPPMNFLAVKVDSSLSLSGDGFSLTLGTEWEDYLVPYQGRSLWLGVRPEHLELSSATNYHLLVCVDLVEALGNDTYLAVHLASNSKSQMQVRISPEEKVNLQDSLYLSCLTDKIHLFDPETENNIRH
ncbi:ABC transporter ATP-binding protein [Spirulina sp. 06S082]|uniref:ABC transporter ATP-binding protein n=1 Tax=Spirulina sp. 06S082 TaxID=3110248 RepID=UPI002B2125DF|nr:ATP-binding cassette domain-containing protein [Spirulina sp. 06S082]MEA5471366.1 ATP-binding cassette domain-containing protein [Spirulina sp. 06S082]